MHACICRAVVLLGLPFPNPADVELQEHMRYLDAISTGSNNSMSSEPQPTVQPAAGQRYYEDLCMKSVNQCIGRVIRHQRDWAAVLLAGGILLLH